MPLPSPQGPRRIAVSAGPADPVATVLLLGALVAALLLLLRHLAPGSGAAEEFGRQLAIRGGPLGCAALVSVLSITLAAPVFAQRSPMLDRLMAAGLPFFDMAALLAMGLSIAAALGAMVAMGRPAMPFAWFLFQGLVAWGCYRLRLRVIAP